ncbi:MAG: hypothetical protein M0R03_23555, partial [Novosphingobium sp.]|nr:hypothetical protein [Novosphingobium sp.]
ENNEKKEEILAKKSENENVEETETETKKIEETPVEDERDEEFIESLRERVKEARHYKEFGGKIAMLFDKYKGVPEFFAERFVNKRKARRLDSVRFKEALINNFPDIPVDEIPSEASLRRWRLKYYETMKNGEGSNLQLAMTDEVRIISVMQNFNFFEDRMKLYKKSKEALRKAEDVLNMAYEISKKMKVPTAAFGTALGDFFKALEARGVHLDHLDSLAIRFGMMPSRNEKNLFMNTQINNYTLSDDHKEIKEALGLTDEDFSDDNISNTFTKILNYYADKSGKTILGTGPDESEQPKEIEYREPNEVLGDIENSEESS